MARHLTVSAVTADPYVIDPSSSHQHVLDSLITHWSERIESVLPDRPDLIVLPEHGDRPVARRSPLIPFPREQIEDFTEYKGNQLRDALAEIAIDHATRIAYSGYRIDDDGRLRNSTQLIGTHGETVGVYDKNYLTIPENERRGVTHGEHMTVMDTDIGRIAPVICFDLNFEQGLQELAPQRPEIIAFSSNYHGGFMQQYWAYSARSYFIGSVIPPNRASIISPTGQVMAQSTNYSPHVTATINLDYAVVHIDENRPKFTAAKRKYGRDLQIHDPGQVGFVLLTSENSDLTIAQVMEEFEIVDIDDYFGRSSSLRQESLGIRPALSSPG